MKQLFFQHASHNRIVHDRIEDRSQDNLALHHCDHSRIKRKTGDVTQVEGQTTTTRVVSVHHAAGTLTLDMALAWSAGTGVSPPYAGGAPDIGLHETD